MKNNGALAQLEEHLFDVQEVTGSIPVAPTMMKMNHLQVVFFVPLA